MFHHHRHRCVPPARQIHASPFRVAPAAARCPPGAQSRPTLGRPDRLHHEVNPQEQPQKRCAQIGGRDKGPARSADRTCTFATGLVRGGFPRDVRRPEGETRRKRSTTSSRSPGAGCITRGPSDARACFGGRSIPSAQDLAPTRLAELIKLLRRVESQAGLTLGKDLDAGSVCVSGRSGSARR